MEFCQSCQQNEIEVSETCDDKEFAYKVCKPCHHRLLNKALRPLEFFNIKAKHGEAYLLHDEFYDENGIADQPYIEVIEDSSLKFPKLSEIKAEIVRMLSDDFLGTTRERYENPLLESYIKAFEEIDADKNNELIVALNDDEIVGTLQITFTPSISFQGGKRATVESVRVDEKYRGQGIGKELMRWAIERARKENCVAMQLTTNAERQDAIAFMRV